MIEADLKKQWRYYSLTRQRTIKWRKKNFWCLFVVNSRIIFWANSPGSPVDNQFKYRANLCRQLVQPLPDLKASPECLTSLQMLRRRKLVLVSNNWIASMFLSSEAHVQFFFNRKRYMVAKGRTRNNLILPQVWRVHLHLASALNLHSKYSTE